MIIVPALNPVTNNGVASRTLNHYARRASDTWVDAFLLSGSTTRGDLLTAEQRAYIIDLWLEVTSPQRLIACCWDGDDISAAAARGVSALLVLRGLANYNAAINLLQSLPVGTYIYSHPMYTPTTFDARLADMAREKNVMPAGGKIAKIGVSEISSIREVAGEEFALWDGSSRHIEASLAAGASGIIATPLSDFPEPFPSENLRTLQSAVNKAQRLLDEMPDRETRTAYLLRKAFRVESSAFLR